MDVESMVGTELQVLSNLLKLFDRESAPLWPLERAAINRSAPLQMSSTAWRWNWRGTRDLGSSKREGTL